MMSFETIEIKEISLPTERSALCDMTLRALPDWFGIEEAIAEYVLKSAGMPFFAAFCDGVYAGFVSVLRHFESCAEVYVMGVMPEFRRNGIGKCLIERFEKYCVDSGCEFLTVKTLDSSHPDENYAKTRKFYESMGFKPLEVFKTLWGEGNPCLMLVKKID